MHKLFLAMDVNFLLLILEKGTETATCSNFINIFPVNMKFRDLLNGCSHT